MVLWVVVVSKHHTRTIIPLRIIRVVGVIYGMGGLWCAKACYACTAVYKGDLTHQRMGARVGKGYMPRTGEWVRIWLAYQTLS